MENQKLWNERTLFIIFMNVVKGMEVTMLKQENYLSFFGMTCDSGASLSALWRYVIEELYTAEEVAAVYRRLCNCLEQGELFDIDG